MLISVVYIYLVPTHRVIANVMELHTLVARNASIHRIKHLLQPLLDADL